MSLRQPEPLSSQEDAFRAAINIEPRDPVLRGAYSDWLEEQGRPGDAECQRALIQHVAQESVRHQQPEVQLRIRELQRMKSDNEMAGRILSLAGFLSAAFGLVYLLLRFVIT